MSAAIANDSGHYRFYAICVFVIAIHFGIIAWFTYQKENFKPILPPPRLLVQTISLGSPIQSVTVENKFDQVKPEITQAPPVIEAPIINPKVDKKETPIAKAEPKKTQPAAKPEPKKTAATAKVETKPIPDKPKTTPKPAATPAKTTTAPSKPSVETPKNPAADAASAKKKQLLAEAQNNLKLASSPSKKPLDDKNKIALAAPPKALGSLQSESSANSNIAGSVNLESHYGMELTSRLKRLLKLPQYGDVDIQLTLFRSGKVAKLVVTNSQNALNKDHVEKMLPTLTFPPFGSGFAGEEQHTFKIRLSNDLAR